MSDVLLNNAKYSQWAESHTFENCKLNRKDYGEFLADYITGEHHGFVLNLNGSWGAGKTEFLKRMYIEMLRRSHPCIYIDAWESDFSKDPLTVVTSELLKQLQLLNFDVNGDESGRELSKFFTKALKGTAIGLAGGLTKFVIDDGTVGVTAMQEWLSKDDDGYLDTITSEYHEQIEAIKKIRENLASLASVLSATHSTNIPVVVLVDELDRCRPTYAIEMLEVIKHFFNTESFVFVIATDTEQLSRSIKAVYGQDFESKDYLKRFFDRKATLPTPDIQNYLTACTIDYSPYINLKLYPKLNNASSVSDSVNYVVSLLAKAYNLHIRDIDQLMSKFQSCLRSAVSTLESTQNAQYINYPALLIGLIEQEKCDDIYNSRTNFYAPEPKILNSDYQLSSELTLGNFIKLSMSNITYFKGYTDDMYGESELFRLPNQELRDQIQTSRTSEFRTFLMDTINNNQYGNFEGNHKHWSWEDMKKVIELAGSLE